MPPVPAIDEEEDAPPALEPVVRRRPAPVATPQPAPAQPRTGTTGGLVPTFESDAAAPAIEWSADPAERRTQVQTEIARRRTQQVQQARPFATTDEQTRLATQVDPRAAREFEGQVEDQHQFQQQTARAATIAARRSEIDQQKARNNDREATMRGSGQQFYTDANGDLQPVIEGGTGRALYHPSTWEPATHPKDGTPALSMRDRYGQRQYKAPPLKLNPSDPYDQYLYADFSAHGISDSPRAMKISDAAQSNDMKVRALGVRGIANQRGVERRDQRKQAIEDKRAVDLEFNGARNEAEQLTSELNDPAKTARMAPAALAAMQSRRDDLVESTKPGGALHIKQKNAEFGHSVAQATLDRDARLDQEDVIRSHLAGEGVPDPESDPTFQANHAELEKANDALTKASEDQAKYTALMAPKLQAQAEVARLNGKGGGAANPSAVLKLQKQSSDIAATLAGAGENVDPKVLDRLTEQKKLIDSRATQEFAKLAPDQQKRVSDITRDPTMLERGMDALGAAETGFNAGLIDAGAGLARAVTTPGSLGEGARTAIDTGAASLKKTFAGGAGSDVPEVQAKLADSTTHTLAETAGGMASVVAPGAAMGELGKVAGLGEHAASLLSRLGTVAAGGAQGGEGLRREAIDKLTPSLRSGKITRDEYERSVGLATLTGDAIGAAGFATFPQFASRIAGLPAGKTLLDGLLSKAARGGASGATKWLAGEAGTKAVSDVLREGVQAGGVGFAQTLANDLAAKEIFDPSREIDPAKASKSAGEMGVIGALASALTHVSLPRRGGEGPAGPGATAAPRPGSPSAPDAAAKFEAAAREAENPSAGPAAPFAPRGGPSTAAEAAKVLEPALAEKANVPPPAKSAVESAQVFAEGDQANRAAATHEEGAQALVDELQQVTGKPREAILATRAGKDTAAWADELQNEIEYQKSPLTVDPERRATELKGQIAQLDKEWAAHLDTLAAHAESEAKIEGDKKGAKERFDQVVSDAKARHDSLTERRAAIENELAEAERTRRSPQGAEALKGDLAAKESPNENQNQIPEVAPAAKAVPAVAENAAGELRAAEAPRAGEEVAPTPPEVEFADETPAAPVDSGPRDTTVSTGTGVPTAKETAMLAEQQKLVDEHLAQSRAATTEKPSNAIPEQSAGTPAIRQAPENREGIRSENAVDQGAAGARQAKETVSEAVKPTRTKASLVREILGERPKDYARAQQWDKNLRAMSKWTTEELQQRADSRRTEDAKTTKVNEGTKALYPEINALAEKAGTGWRTALKERAAQEGIANFNPPTTSTRGEAAVNLARHITEKRLNNPSSEEPGTPAAKEPTPPKPTSPETKTPTPRENSSDTPAQEKSEPAGGQSVKDPNIGRSWNSRYGKQTIVGRVGEGTAPQLYSVKTEGTGAERRYSMDGIEDVIKRNEHELTPEYAAEQKEAKETEQLRKERDERQAARQKKELDEISEFTSGDTPMGAGKKRDALLKTVSRDGVPMTRKTMIDRAVADGYTVKTNKAGERELTSKADTFLSEDATSKTGMDYAEHLIAKRDAVEAPPLTPPKDAAPISRDTAPPTPESVEGNKLNKNWTAFSPESGSLGIPRAEMPQVKSEARGALVNFLNARGLTTKKTMVMPDQLRPTQAEFSPEKVQAARDHTGTERPILISSDGHVVDGHHQWLANLDDTMTPMPVIKINAPIDKVLAEMKEFPSAEAAKGAAPEAAKPEAAPAATPKLSDRAIDALNKAIERNKAETKKFVGSELGLAYQHAERAALEIAVLAVRAGRKVAEVMKMATDRFKAKFPNATPDDVKKFEDNMVPHLQQSPVQQGGPAPTAIPPTTGIAHRVSEARGVEAERGEGVSVPDSIARGRELIAKGFNANKAIEDFDKTGKISSDAMAAVRAHEEVLSRAVNKAQDDHGTDSPQAKAAWDEVKNWIDKIKPMQTEWHKIGQAQQGETEIDTGTFHGLQKAVYEATGRDMTPKEATEAKQIVTKVKDATEATEAAQDKVLKTVGLPTKTTDASIKAAGDVIKTIKPGDEWTPVQARALWHVAKANYIDRGKTDFNDIRAGLATDYGLSKDDIARGMAAPKGVRPLTNEMYAKMAERRRVINQAKQWVADAKYPGYQKFFRNIPNAFFNLATFGHGTVWTITHAGNQYFLPKASGELFKDLGRSFKLMGVTDKGAYHERMMQDLVRDPNYITAKRAGLANDPFRYQDDYQNPGVVKVFKDIGLMGNRGFDGMKMFRQFRFNQEWDATPASLRTPDGAKLLADNINKATGITKSSKLPNWTNTAFFAPKLEMSRWAFLYGDPAKDVKTLTLDRKTASPEERHAAVRDIRQKLTMAGTYLGALALNQAVLSSTGSDQQVNLTNPRAGDWLSFKGFGHNFGVVGPMVSSVRFLQNIAHDFWGERSKLEQVQSTRGSEAGTRAFEYARGKLSPFAGVALDAASQSDAVGRPMPWSKDPLSYRAKQIGASGPYSYGEYASKKLLPIPLEEAATEIWRSQGASDDQIGKWMRAIAIGAASGGTGVRVTPQSPDYQPKGSRGKQQDRPQTPVQFAAPR